MKIYKIIFIMSILLISQTTVFGQYFGIKFGAGESGIHAANGGNDCYKSHVGEIIGLSYEQILSQKLSFKSGILYQHKEFEYEFTPGHRQSYYYQWIEYTDIEYSETEFITIPATLNYKLSLTKNIRFIVGAGLSFNVLLKDSELTKESTATLSAGILGEAGIELGNLMLGASYDYGISAYNDYGEKFKTIIFSLSYRFGGRATYFNSNVYTTTF